jgi:hypothetical protein
VEDISIYQGYEAINLPVSNGDCCLLLLSPVSQHLLLHLPPQILLVGLVAEGKFAGNPPRIKMKLPLFYLIGLPFLPSFCLFMIRSNVDGFQDNMHGLSELDFHDFSIYPASLIFVEEVNVATGLEDFHLSACLVALELAQPKGVVLLHF